MCVVLIFGAIQGVCLGEFGSADGRIRQAPICDISLPNSVYRCNPQCWDAQREDLGLGRQKDSEIRVITCVWWIKVGERASGLTAIWPLGNAAVASVACVEEHKIVDLFAGKLESSLVSST